MDTRFGSERIRPETAGFDLARRDVEFPLASGQQACEQYSEPVHPARAVCTATGPAAQNRRARLPLGVVTSLPHPGCRRRVDELEAESR